MHFATISQTAQSQTAQSQTAPPAQATHAAVLAPSDLHRTPRLHRALITTLATAGLTLAVLLAAPVAMASAQDEPAQIDLAPLEVDLAPAQINLAPEDLPEDTATPPKPSPRIAGGFQASSLDGIEFLGYLQIGPNQCGGSLVAPDWVMTAAHCLEGTPASDVTAYFNVRTLNQPPSPIIRPARRVELHPGFDNWFRNDIALIQIDPITTIQPISLATEADAALWPVGTAASFYGWGRLANGQQTTELRGASMAIVPRSDCSFYDWFICVGEANDGITTGTICNGDSGGPLFVRRPDGSPVQIGIANVIFGDMCEPPGGFADVPALESWWGPILAVNEPEPSMGGVYATVTCLAGNGRIDVNVVNDATVSASYTLTVGSLAPRTAQVAAERWWRSPVTGRPDGLIRVTLTRNQTTLLDQYVTVDCDTTPTVSTPEVDVLTWCVNGNGMIWAQFANPTGSNRSYILDVEGLRRSTTASAYGATFRGVSGRTNGSYNVAVEANGQVIHTELITVSC